MTQFPKISFVAVLAAVAGAPALAEFKFDNNSGGSVVLYGQFDPAYLSFDDGVTTTSEVVDNTNSNSRVGLDLRQPYGANRFRFNFETALGLRASAGVSQTNTPSGLDWQRTDIRKVDFSLKTGKYGTFSAGQGSMATDGVAETDLSGTTLVTYSSIPDTAGSFEFRTSAGALSGSTIGDNFSDFDGGRKGRVRYDSPSFSGFTISAAWGKEILAEGNDDEFMDVALRYANEFGAVKLAGAVGISRRDRGGVYRDDTIGSISMLHDSGVNATLALGDREGAGDYRYGKLGYIGNWFSAGTTALSVDYYDGADTISVGSSSESLGIGVVQKVDSANLEVYLGYRTYELNETTATYQDASSVLFGTRLKF